MNERLNVIQMNTLYTKLMKQTHQQTEKRRKKEKGSESVISKNNEVPVEWHERVNAS